MSSVFEVDPGVTGTSCTAVALLPLPPRYRHEALSHLLLFTEASQGEVIAMDNGRCTGISRRATRVQLAWWAAWVSEDTGPSLADSLSLWTALTTGLEGPPGTVLLRSRSPLIAHLQSMCVGVAEAAGLWLLSPSFLPSLLYHEHLNILASFKQLWDGSSHVFL